MTSTKKHKPFNDRQGSAHSRGYTHKWREARLVWLASNPLCVHCQAQGRITTANEVDHIIPHRGDNDLFWDTNNWQSLCKRCHGRKSSLEANDKGLYVPDTLLAPPQPVYLVCGPSGAGKTTYAQQHATQLDLIIDLDIIKARLSDTPIHETPEKHTKPALMERNRMLATLHNRSDIERVFFIVSAGRTTDRRQWVELLKPRQVIILATPPEICRQRLKERKHAKHYINAMQQWWQDYERQPFDEVIRCS